jgi:molybdate transport system substrate-binding protein
VHLAKENVMKSSFRILAAAFAAFLLFIQPGMGGAAEIKVLCAAGLRVAMNELAPNFERVSKDKLILTFATVEVAVKQIQGGETADVIVLPREGIDALIKNGKAIAGSVSPIARVDISVAVAKGAPKPDISSPDAFKRALLAAKSITYLDPATGGASGIIMPKMLDQMGIAREMKEKTILVPLATAMPGLLATGKAQIAMHQTGLLVTLSDIDIVGPVPASLYPAIVFTATTTNSTKDAGAAKALIDFLRSPESARVIKAKGMIPAGLAD